VDRLSDIATWHNVFLKAATELGTKVAEFLPSLFGAVLILLFGWLLSRSVELAAGRALRAFGLDRAAVRLQLSGILERAGVKMALSEVVARLLFWLLMLTFVLSSVETLGLTAVTATIVRRQSVSDSTWPLLRDGSRFHPRRLLPPGSPSSSFASYVS
jgi:hypothetical protein